MIIQKCDTIIIKSGLSSFVFIKKKKKKLHLFFVILVEFFCAFSGIVVFFRDFNCTMKSLGVLNYDTKLSSAGLVYAHYGKSVIARLLNLKNDDPKVACLFEKLYETFVESVDAIDNGIPQYDGIPR